MRRIESVWLAKLQVHFARELRQGPRIEEKNFALLAVIRDISASAGNQRPVVKQVEA